MPSFASLSRFLLTSLLALLLLSGQADARAPQPITKQPTMLENPAVQDFIQQMGERYGFDQKALEQSFATQRPDQRVIRMMTPAPPPSQTAPNWLAYRERFVNPRRINRGVAFWDTYAMWLDKASRDYGVPAEIIVAIIGVETEYGRNMGNFNIFNALASLGFYGERRQPFFRNELEQYLLLARDNGIDITSARGSFAGALGIPQFMPSSQRSWGIDYDSDGHVNLIDSPVDAIGSVANFFKAHGWSAGAVPVLEVKAPQPFPETFANIEVKPGITLAQYRTAGFEFNSALPDSTLATLVALSSPHTPTQYWLGLNNYYVITRYNRSAAYAMSVIQLGAAIRQARENMQANEAALLQ